MNYLGSAGIDRVTGLACVVFPLIMCGSNRMRAAQDATVRR
jgi:hypothetical protein